MPLTLVSIKYSYLPTLLIIIGTAIVVAHSSIDASAQTGTDSRDWPASIELADLLHTESVIIDNLRNYVNALDDKISTIKREIQAIRGIYDVIQNDTGKYFENPINTYSLIRRMTYDWEAIRELAWKDVTGHIIENITRYREVLSFPSEEDLDEAVGKLLKIQDIYQLDSSQVALGELDGVKFGSQMTWSDCLVIGQQSSRQGEHTVAKVWFQTALEKLPKDLDNKENKLRKVQILESMAILEYQNGNLKEALRITEQILELDPKNKRAIGALATIKEKLKKRSINPKKPVHPSKPVEVLLAEEVCRGASEQYTSSSTLQRTCSYSDTGIPFAPVQLEVVSTDPSIVIYHNIFSDAEIGNFKNLVKKMKTERRMRGVLFQGFADKLEWISGYDASRFGNWTFVENHFDDEIDFSQDCMSPRNSSPNDRQKIAGMVWIQLSEPKLGGYVAFPQLDIRIGIPKGSILLWSALDEFGDVDYRVDQVLCPVIAGYVQAAKTSIRVE